MACGALEGKTWCGYPRKRVLCCSLLTVLIAAAAIITTLVMVLRPPDDIETIEQTESEDALTAGDLTILKTATFPVSDTVVAGTLSLLEVSEDGSFYLALNDFSVSDACNELEVRLSDATSTSTAAASGVLAVPLSVDDASITADFTEPLDADFDVELYDQAAVWCTATDEILGDSVDLTTRTTTDSGATVVRQASLSPAGSYTVEGLVQVIGTGSIVDDVLVTTYSLRFEDISVSAGPDVFLYLTTDANDPDDVDAAGSLTVLVEEAERGTFSFTGTFSQDVPDDFVSPETYVAAVVWCDQFSVLFGSGIFEDI